MPSIWSSGLLPPFSESNIIYKLFYVFPRAFFHGKSYLDAVQTCYALGSAECPSRLIHLNELPALLGEYDPMVMPEYSRLNAVCFSGWVDEDESAITVPGITNHLSQAIQAQPTDS